MSRALSLLITLMGCQQSYSLGMNKDSGAEDASSDAMVVDSGLPDTGVTDAGRPDVPDDPAPCMVGGCSGQLCSDQPGLGSTCEWLEEYACYRSATCERQPDGECGWTDTQELRDCLDNGGPACTPSGCNGEICASEPLDSPCVVLPEHECYRQATCERQATGECGWTDTPELQMCLADAGS